MCMFIVMDESPKGFGLCWKEAQGNRKPLNVITDRKCKNYKLGAMHQVRIRGVRIKDGVATLR